MPPTVPVYLELGSKRVIAGALDWPGWCRGARREDEALATLASYAPRYAAAVGAAVPGFAIPAGPAALEVVERLSGNATTDFGAPAVAPASDQRELDEAELQRLAALLEACWAAFDRAVEAARGTTLAKGPRGGGRELDAIVAHAREAEWGAYLPRLGGAYRGGASDVLGSEVPRVRAAVLDALAARAHGEPLPPRRGTAPLWPPRYFVRRAAWHLLDHAWEIEDRAQGLRPR